MLESARLAEIAAIRAHTEQPQIGQRQSTPGPSVHRATVHMKKMYTTRHMTAEYNFLLPQTASCLPYPLMSKAAKEHAQAPARAPRPHAAPSSCAAAVGQLAVADGRNGK